MISIESWRAIIGLFNCSRSSISRSAFRGDHSQPITSSSLSGVDNREGVLFSAPRASHLLKGSAILLLFVAAIGSLVLLSAGDVQINPGPISRGAKPTFQDLQFMSYTGEDGSAVPFRLMERIRPQVLDLAIALGFPQHKIAILKTEHDPVYYLLNEWLSGRNLELDHQRPLTWRTLIDALNRANLVEEVNILNKMIDTTSFWQETAIPTINLDFNEAISSEDDVSVPTRNASSLMTEDSATGMPIKTTSTYKNTDVRDHGDSISKTKEILGYCFAESSSIIVFNSYPEKIGKLLSDMRKPKVDPEFKGKILLHACNNSPFRILTESRTNTQLDIETLDNVEKFVSERKVDWRSLGLKLGLRHTTLEQIAMNYQDDPSQCRRAMLTAWLLQSDTDSQMGPSSWSRLKSALEETGEKSIVAAPRLSMLSKALRRGYVRMKMTKLLISGAAGTGKTSLTAMLLGKPPVIEHDSTALLRPLRHARFTAGNDSSLQWECFNTPSDLLQLLAGGIEELVADDQPEPNIQYHSLQQQRFINNFPSLSRSNLISGNAAGNYEKSDLFTDLVTLLEKAQKSNRLQTVQWIYTIDSGGQTAFQDILPALIRGNSLTMHTLKLNERLSDHVKMTCCVNGEAICSTKDLSFTNLQLIRTLVRSSSSQRLSDGNGAAIRPPRCIVVGTFYDKISECRDCETMEYKNDQLSESLQLSEDLLIETDGIIFPVNTTVEGQERKKVASELRDIVTESEGTSIEIQIPVKWFLFELEVRCHVEKSGLGIISKQECFKIGHMFGMTEEEVIECIKYLHEQTLLFYFDEILPDTVFINTQSILEKVSAIIFISLLDTSMSPSSRKAIRKLPSSHKNLQMQGRFSIELLRCLPDALQCAWPSKEPLVLYSDAFTIDDFLTLLEYLHVAVKLPNGEYFIPCVLSTEPPCQQVKSTNFKNADPLYIGWDMMPIPLGLFPALVVHLLQGENLLKLQLSKGQQLRNAIFLNCISIEGQILLVDSINWIEVYYSGKNSKCPLIRRAIFDGIFIVLEKLGYHVSCHLRGGFLCQADDDCKLTPHPCFVPTGKDQSNLSCSQKCYKNYPCSSQQSCWFADPVN